MASGILFGIYSDILSGTHSYMPPGLLFGFLSGISSHSVWHLFWHCIWHSTRHLFRTYSGLHSGIYSCNLSNILSGILSDILFGMRSVPGSARCILSSQYRVQVQAATLFSARNMAWIRSCPQSRRAGGGVLFSKYE